MCIQASEQTVQSKFAKHTHLFRTEELTTEQNGEGVWVQKKRRPEKMRRRVSGGRSGGVVGSDKLGFMVVYL